MPPCTVHVVLTLADCVADGGHYYSKYSLNKSLAAGIREHVFGNSDTNTQYPMAEFILHNLVDGYVRDIQALGSDGESVDLEGKMLADCCSSPRRLRGAHGRH